MLLPGRECQNGIVGHPAGDSKLLGGIEKTHILSNSIETKPGLLTVVMLAVGRVAGTWEALGEYLLDAGINE